MCCWINASEWKLEIKKPLGLRDFAAKKVKCSEKSCFFKITYFLGKVKKFEHIKVHKMEYSMNKKTLKAYKIQKILEK